MSIFNMFKQADINEGVRRFRQTAGAVLLDVRTEPEFSSGRIPGSVNIPLQSIGDAEDAILSKDTPLYVYCRSGNRSGQAAVRLKMMGYTDVKNIGGINDYRGMLEG